MNRPLVAVVAYGLPPGRVEGWGSAAAAVPMLYLDALRRAGTRPVLLSAPEDPSETDGLEPFDGLVLIGGGDVDPARYGQRRHDEDYGIEPDRDALEIDLLHEADRTGVPTLAICRGIQLVNVAFGGTLHQHLPDLPALDRHSADKGGPAHVHEVKVAESSHLHRASDRTTLECASWHHQGIDQLGEGLIPIAWTGDGLIEAIERPESWVLAVQWHPEETAATDPSQQSLFDAFGEQAGARRSGR